MKRRDFLKTLPIIAGAPMALAETSPFPQTANGRHLIALGTSACYLASNHSSELLFDIFTFFDFKDQEGFRDIPFTTPDYFREQSGNSASKRGVLPCYTDEPRDSKSPQWIERGFSLFCRIGMDD